MKTFQRREFLRRITATFGSVAVVGCGGGAAGSGDAAAAEGDSAPPADSPVTQPPAATPSAPAPTPTGAMRFTLVSPIASSAAPFCIGYAFRKGHVPAGSSVAADIAHLQVSPKNFWPDGSLKFAVVAGRAPLSAGVPLTVSLSTAAAKNASDALSLADLRATSASAAIECGAFGMATWSGADWDSPFKAWVAGSEMSSWIYRKPVGADAHLVAWLEVRLYAGGVLEVLPWIENGYLNVAGPTNKNATYGFVLGGVRRFDASIDLPNHCRTPLISGTATSHWLHFDPQVFAQHDRTYLQATRLVPSYRASVASNSKAVASLPTTFVPLQQGSYAGSMGTAGYHPSIGLLPEWDVLYLTTSSLAPFKAVQFNAYSAGRFGIHFRDETTQRPLRFSRYPTLVLGGGSGVGSRGASTTNSYTPTATGSTPAGWSTSHHPSVGFMAYLVTGRWYFMEEVQFCATLNYLKLSNATRSDAAGLHHSWSASTTRGSAWALRSLAQAACITPDEDADLRGELLASLSANAISAHATYVLQANCPQGFVKPYQANRPPNQDGYSPGIDPYHDAMWMQDFFFAAWGYWKSLDLPIGAAAADARDAFFHWKAKAVVGRFGGAGANEYLYRDAAVYGMAVAPDDDANWDTGSGPWYANWGQVYAATWASPVSIVGRQPPPKEIGDGSLRGNIAPSSYWANLQPALAYAVDHGASGAQEAFGRMTSAPNWAQLASGFDAEPVWSVRPAL